jgi:hypothetical protein
MSLTSPYAGVEAEYRRERIAASFRDHQHPRRHLLRRRNQPGRSGA